LEKVVHVPFNIPFLSTSGVESLCTGHLHGGQQRLPPVSPVITQYTPGINRFTLEVRCDVALAQFQVVWVELVLSKNRRQRVLTGGGDVVRHRRVGKPRIFSKKLMFDLSKPGTQRVEIRGVAPEESGDGFNEYYLVSAAWRNKLGVGKKVTRETGSFEGNVSFAFCCC
jgi:hypothetical protein